MATRNISRAYVSSVVESSGTSSLQQVPFREKIYTANELQTPAQVARALQQLQREIALGTQSARTNPMLGGTYFASRGFAAGVPLTFAHKVATTGQVAWLRSGMRIGATPAIGDIFEVSQSAARGTITLVATCNMVADLYFYERPGAQGYTTPDNTEYSGSQVPTWTATSNGLGYWAPGTGGSGREAGIQSITASGTIDDNVEIVEVHTSDGSFSLALPSVASRKTNQVCGPMLVVDADGDAATNPFKLTGTINGVSSYTVSSNWGSALLFAGTSQWWAA